MLFKCVSDHKWLAYGVHPWLPDEQLPHWWREYDSRRVCMTHGHDSASEAVQALLDKPRNPERDDLQTRMARLTCEIVRLTDVVRR